ncbi:MAG: hypothetical protein WCH46_03605 [bacterium]
MKIYSSTFSPPTLVHWGGKTAKTTACELNEKFRESQSLSLAQLKQCGAQGMGIGGLGDYFQRLFKA